MKSTEKASLGEIARYIRGITFKPDDRVTVGSPGSVVCMRTANIQEELDQSDLIAVPDSIVAREEQRLRSGDILVSSANSWNLVGKCVAIPALDYQATAGGFISIVRPDSALVDPRYLFRWLSDARSQHAIRRCARQTTNIANLSVQRFLSLELPLPPLAAQRRIAAVLDKADGVRRKRREAIGLLDEFLRSVFLEMFGDPSPDWPILAVEDVALNGARGVVIGPFGSALRVDDYRTAGRPVVFVRDVRPNQFEWISNVFVSEEKFTQLRGHQVRPLDVLVTKMGSPPGVAAVYGPRMPVGIVTADIIRVRCDNVICSPHYLAAVINSPHFQARLRRVTEGATRPKLTLREFRAVTFRLPPLATQQQFERILGKTRAAGQPMAKGEESASQLFNSLAQRAFGGT